MDNCQSSYCSEQYRNLFKNFSFRFEGLIAETEKGFTKVVKDLGGEVRDNAPFTLVEKEYFIKMTHTENTDFYDITYIWNSIEAKKALDISSYRLFYDNIDCENCGHRMKIKRIRMDTEKTSKEFLNYSQNALSDVIKQEQCSKLIERAIQEKCNEIENNDIKTENLSTNNEDEFKNYKKFSKTIESSDSETDIDQPATKTSSKTNGIVNISKWIDPKSIFNQTELKENDVTHSSRKPSTSDVSVDSDEEEKYIDRWWITKDLKESEKCKHFNCTFTPEPHQQHNHASRMMSEFEKKIMLKYLIDTDSIEKAKGTKIWQQMHSDGYLTHRTEESLRNCIRRTILPSIVSYRLPVDLCHRFQELDETKPKGKKK